MGTDHIKYRNMFAQVGLVIITLGIYGVYWYYSTLKELHVANGNSDGVGLWTVLAVIPIADLFAFWHYSSEADEFLDGKYPAFALFTMWIIFAPLLWLLVQKELNRAARGEAERRTNFQNLY